MNISDFLFNAPLGVTFVVILLLVAAIVAWGSTGNGWKMPRLRKKDPSPVPESPQQPKPAAVVEPAPPKQEPKPAPPTPEPSPEIKPEAPCAKEREEIERLTEENAKLKRPKPPKEVTEANVSQLLAEFGKINSKGEKDIRREAEESEPAIERVMVFLKKFATHLGQTGYNTPTPEQLMKLLWGAAKAHRKPPR